MIPYGAGWDEHHYLNRIWEMSKGYLIPNQYLIGLNGKIPSAFLEISYYSQKTIEPQSLAQWQNQFSVHIAKDNVLSGSTGAGYFPTFYILQAFIMGICNRVFNIPCVRRISINTFIHKGDFSLRK